MVQRATEFPDVCTLGKEYQCPSPYSCYGTGNGYVGYCNCNAYYGYVRTPPTIDSDPNAHFTCEKDFIPWAFSVIVTLYLFFAFMEGIYTQIVLGTRLKRHGAMKNNVGTRLLFLNFFFNYIPHTAHKIILLMNLFQIDPNMWFHDSVRSYLFILISFYIWNTSFEALCAWIDVVQKSSTLSKTTSKSLTILSWFFRVVAATLSFSILYYQLLTDQKYFYGVKVEPKAMVTVSILLILTAWRLNRILCPKMDRKSKNYSKAVTIYVVAFTQSFALYLHIFGVQMYMKNFFNARGGNINLFSTVMWAIGDLIAGQSWIAYIKRGNIKILAQYEDSKGKGGMLGLFASSAASTVSSVSLVSSIEKSSVVITQEEVKVGPMEKVDEEES